MLKTIFKSGASLALLFAVSNTYALEIHEWGTFTSMVNEDGKLMSGMHHEEVGLPSFVYGLRHEGPGIQNNARTLGNPCRPHSKCSWPSPESELYDVIPYNEFNTTVTQKMETPVIYFYGKKGEKVQVQVGFPGGMISQWFPAATSFNLHNEEFKNGFMNWDVTLKEVTDIENYPKTNKDSIWNPARVTNANTIQTNANGTEEERFIFYRGIADFSVPLKVNLVDLADDQLQVTVMNTSAQTVPALFYLQTDKEIGVKKFLALPALKAGESKTFITGKILITKSASAVIQKALTTSGLFADEALSMLKTWDSSYFKTDGERLLYILPQAWTENILPIKLSPEPAKLVRVLIGRIELFSKRAQTKLAQSVDKNAPELKEDRLLEAKMNALKH